MVIFIKRLRCSKNGEERINNDVPILLVYEEAHKYVPNSDLQNIGHLNTPLKE